MICAPCRNQRHDECPTVTNDISFPDGVLHVQLHRDKTWCDCQHRPTQKENK